MNPKDVNTETPTPSRAGCQVVDVPGLQVNGARATRARYPNIPGGIEVAAPHRGASCCKRGNRFWKFLEVCGSFWKFLAMHLALPCVCLTRARTRADARTRAHTRTHALARGDTRARRCRAATAA
jgi:hypothetical protein